ncbi:MAG: copper chaperone PCu(A)C [Beijerinckiaceae bacterium]
MLSIARAAVAASLIVVAIAGFAPLAGAHDYQHGELRIGHPWTRATAPAARVAAGFLTVENKGREPDRLVSATFGGSASVEVHEMAMDAGVMRMRELPKGIEIAAGGKIELKPGGYHLMFIGLKSGLKEGESLRGTLVFEKAGSIEVDFKVESMGARGDGQQHHHHHGGHAQPPKSN